MLYEVVFSACTANTIPNEHVPHDDTSIAPCHRGGAPARKPLAPSGDIPLIDSAVNREDAHQERGVLELQRDELRQALAAETQARKSDHAIARQSLDRLQDLNAEMFRIREQARASQRDAEENYGRCLDLEAQLREQGEQRDADLRQIEILRMQVDASSAQLGQA